MIQRLLLAWGFSLALSACGPGAAIEPTFTSIREEVFLPSCSAGICHASAGRRGDLVLDDEPEVLHARLVNGRVQNEAAAGQGLVMVKPGAPDESFLVLKMRHPIAPEYGDLMPYGAGGAFEQEALAAIEEWIRRGAKRD